jgi:hypothetical protein
MNVAWEPPEYNWKHQEGKSLFDENSQPRKMSQRMYPRDFNSCNRTATGEVFFAWSLVQALGFRMLNPGNSQ